MKRARDTGGGPRRAPAGASSSGGSASLPAPASPPDERPKYPQAARALLRDSLLLAAADLLTEYSWSDITMAAIATRAGVSRQTLYNEFGTREEFAQAFAVREADLFLSRVERTIAAHADEPQRALSAAFAGFLRDASGSALVQAIVRRDPRADDLLALFTSRGGPIVAVATARIARAVAQHWPRADVQSVQFAAECLVRLAISHASLPTRSIEEAASAVVTLFGPFIAQVLK